MECSRSGRLMRLQPLSRLVHTSPAVMAKARLPSTKALRAAARTPSVRCSRNAVMAKARVPSRAAARALSVRRSRKALMAKSRVSSKKAPRAVARRRPSGAPGWRQGRRPRISCAMIVGHRGRWLWRCPSGGPGRC